MLFLIVLLKIILYIILFLLGMAVLLLIIPFTYSGEAQLYEGYRLRINLGWAWNFVKVRADVSDDSVDVAFHFLSKRVYKLNDRKKGEEQSQKKAEKEKKKEKRNEKRGPRLKDITNKEFLKEILEYIKKVLSIAKPKYLHLYGSYGFEDPALMGIVSGFVGIIRSVLPDAKLALNPVFDDEIIDLDFRVKGSLTVGSVAYHTLRTVFKKPVRGILFKKNK